MEKRTVLFFPRTVSPLTWLLPTRGVKVHKNDGLVLRTSVLKSWFGTIFGTVEDKILNMKLLLFIFFVKQWFKIYREPYYLHITVILKVTFKNRV